MHNDSKIQHINSIAEVNQLLHSGKPTVIDFWAKWCGPCLKLEPIFEKVAHDLKHSNINFIKIDVDSAEDELKEKYEISSIPTLIYFNKEGKEIKKTFGLVTEKDMNNIILDIEK